MKIDLLQDFGPCLCGGTYDRKQIEIPSTTRGDDDVALRNVPQGACSKCGGRVYKAADLVSIESVIFGRWLGLPPEQKPMQTPAPETD